MLHVGNNLLHLSNGRTRQLIVLRRGHGSKVHLLVLQLELEALDGELHLLDGLVAEVLVHGVALLILAVLGRDGDGGELEGEGQLVVGLGDDFRIGGVNLHLVLERGTAVLYRGGIALVLERYFGEAVVRVGEALLDVAHGGRVAARGLLALAGALVVVVALVQQQLLQLLEVADAGEIENLKGGGQVVVFVGVVGPCVGAVGVLGARVSWELGRGQR